MAESSQSRYTEYTCLPYTRVLDVVILDVVAGGRVYLYVNCFMRGALDALASTLWLYANKFLWEYIVWERRAPDILFRFMSSYESTRDGEIIPREGNCTPRTRARTGSDCPPGNTGCQLDEYLMPLRLCTYKCSNKCKSHAHSKKKRYKMSHVSHLLSSPLI